MECLWETLRHGVEVFRSLGEGRCTTTSALSAHVRSETSRHELCQYFHSRPQLYSQSRLEEGVCSTHVNISSGFFLSYLSLYNRCLAITSKLTRSKLDLSSNEGIQLQGKHIEITGM
jgi:hypothetical protein